MAAPSTDTETDSSRTFTWIFLLDTAFVIFNNLPHRMVIKEMKMHMACPESCFQAATPEDCFAQIGAVAGPSTPFCSLLLRDAIENMCTEELTQESQRNLAQLGPLNLFAIVSGKPNCTTTLDPQSLTQNSFPLHDLPAAKLPRGRGAAGPHTNRTPELDRHMGPVL